MPPAQMQQGTAVADSSVEGSYTGTLSEPGFQDVFDVTMVLTQKGTSVEGTVTMNITVSNNALSATFTVKGNFNGKTLTLRDDQMTEESGGASWCKKIYTASIDANDPSILTGNWKTDGTLYFKKGRLLQGANCRPGTFVLRKASSGN